MPFERGDGFDFYSGVTTGDFPLSRLYTTNVDDGALAPLVSLIAGRFGGQALRLGWNSLSLASTTFLHRPLATPRSAVAHEFAFRRASYNMASTGEGAAIYRLRSGVDVAFIIGVDFHGELLFGTTDLTTNLLYKTAGLGLSETTWATIGYELVVDNAPNGRLLLKLDGDVIEEVTGLDTKALASDTVDGFEYCSTSLEIGNSVNCDFDDAYETDDGFLLDDVYKAEPMRPMLDAGPSEWTPSSGTDHYAMVDDVTSDGDATRLTSATAGDKDRFGLTDLSSDPREIVALQAITIGRKTDAGLTQIRTNFVSGAAIANGHTQTLGLNYGVELDAILVDPDSETALDGFEVNAMQIEIERVT